jgi:hypothetical protein
MGALSIVFATFAVGFVVVGFPGVAAAARGPYYCAHRAVIKTVFPNARAVGFSDRGPTKFQDPRAPVWPGRCVGWWVEYQRIGPTGKVESYADVNVTVYRTHAQALAALTEPLAVPTRTMADGARVRVGDSWALSVIGNVLVGATSSFLPVDANGIPDFKGGPDLSSAVLMRIHRAIHANILRLP